VTGPCEGIGVVRHPRQPLGSQLVLAASASPGRSRRPPGPEQVRRNWTQIFAAVPHLTAAMPGLAEATGPDGENLVWTEWQMSGSRRDGSAP